MSDFYIEVTVPKCLKIFSIDFPVCYTFTSRLPSLIPPEKSFLDYDTENGGTTGEIDSPKIAQIRQKIKEVFGWDCAMNDDMLLKQYTVTDDDDLIVKLK